MTITSEAPLVKILKGFRVKKLRINVF